MRITGLSLGADPLPPPCPNPAACAAQINAKYAGRPLNEEQRQAWTQECGSIGYAWVTGTGCTPATSITKYLPFMLGGFALILVGGMYLQYMRIKKGLPEPGTGRVYLDF